MVPQQNHVNPDEVENSYEFKLIRKILLREFPWIMDVQVPTDEEINKYTLIFLNIIYDPYKLQKITGWPFMSYMKFYLTKPNGWFNDGSVYKSSYLTTAFEITRDKALEIQNEILETLQSVGKSQAIPEELKLGKERKFAVGDFIVPPIPIPPDAVFTNRQSDNT